MVHVSSLFDWLVDGAPGAPTSVDVVDRVGKDLRAAGVPVDRVAAFVTTLHPNVLGRAFFWSPDAPVRVGELTLAVQQSPVFQKSPVAHVMRTREEVRLPLAKLDAEHDYEVALQLKGEGFVDYLCLPLAFTSGEVHAIAFATKSAGGFSDEDLAAIRHVTRPLARVGEILALRRTAANLLSTYVGRNSGERILAGRIRKGDIETIRAVIWFSDLRGFTEMSSRLEPRAVIDKLNELFECQVPAIERHGGEVLKFIGDGLLAIFPCPDEAATAACAAAALAASDEALAAVAEKSLHFGVALHVGEIAYGNIGGSSRLDFTVIGAAVNLAARLEGLTGKLGRPIVVSEELAGVVTRPLDELGAFDLKGVPGAQRVYAPSR